ncbi:Bestrophin, RFP-TM, chloride channel-domain-containing protein, partial [Suillus spraguei]
NAVDLDVKLPTYGCSSLQSKFSDALEPSAWSSFGNALLATALFRCWHILIFFGAWSTAICVISRNVYNLAFQPTLITVFGTVLGFVISYRTTASFERYNEGRRLWSQIVLGSRTFARTVWLHIPDNAYPSAQALTDQQQEEYKAKTLIEKKSAVNLLEAFAVAVKHYLRDEDGITMRICITWAVPWIRAREDSAGSGSTSAFNYRTYIIHPVESLRQKRRIPIDGRPQESVKLPMGPDIRLAPAMNPQVLVARSIPIFHTGLDAD